MSIGIVDDHPLVIEGFKNVINGNDQLELTGQFNTAAFHPVIGEDYTLNVVLNGEIYTATETCMGVPDIENSIELNNSGGFGGDEMEITYYYHNNLYNLNIIIVRKIR
ncbi:hypothetical protein [Pedobacter panaciterrae]|uniref:hypothetical protein n=1 Tax=Pedobacter panaciterrae TaxID=363849 RepID=UPI002599F36C|nr:hypothetical protein [uncultured Pedobacter sp.]